MIANAPRNRRTFLILAALFLLPFVTAWIYFRFLPQWHPASFTNYGQLVTPARPLPVLSLIDIAGNKVAADALQNKWSLIYIGSSECNDDCRKRLVMFRQIRLALGKDLQRAQRVYIAPDIDSARKLQGELAKDHADLRVFADTGSVGARASDFFQSPDSTAIYAVDPLGNWFMIYAGEIDPKGPYGDLHKLMQLSTIG
jgi:cytochrome oxidase Cu insertion factor (SCO1/SenC/PrrC family)